MRASTDPRPAPVAIVHDYLTQVGGAERVVLAMAETFPEAAIYTSFYRPSGTYPEFRGRDVRSTPLGLLPPLRRAHRLALPLLAPAFSRMVVPAEVVICSSSGWAHGATTPGRKIVYCYTPARWLHQPERYLAGAGGPAAVALRALRPRLLAWDARAAATAHRYVAISTAVRDRVRAAYGIEADVLHPPVTLDPDGERRVLDGLAPGYFLCVTRLLPYKNVDRLVEAFAGMPGRRLVVAGEGPEAGRLMAAAPPNVRFVGRVPDPVLRWLYANSRAVVAASHEDFGLTPLEGAAFGKPAAVLRWGGFLDTVVEEETGVFFELPRPDLIREAVASVERIPWDGSVLRRQADRFSAERFSSGLRALVEEERCLVG